MAYYYHGLENLLKAPNYLEKLWRTGTLCSHSQTRRTEGGLRELINEGIRAQSVLRWHVKYLTTPFTTFSNTGWHRLFVLSAHVLSATLPEWEGWLSSLFVFCFGVFCFVLCNIKQLGTKSRLPSHLWKLFTLKNETSWANIDLCACVQPANTGVFVGRSGRKMLTDTKLRNMSP